ncbi:MAG: DPP IV N-terminal domain-containing protein, partial [Bacteroidales bacterium]
MKRTLLTFTILFAFLISWAQQTPVTKANYELAARFSPSKVDKLVFSTQIRPTWFKNSDKFWYSWRSPEGLTYYIVNPATGQKSVLFDNAKLAAQLTEIVKDPFDAQNIPLQALELKDDNTFTFKITSTAMVDKVDKKNKKDTVDKKDTLTQEEILNNKDTTIIKKTQEIKLKRITKGQKVRKIHYFEYDIQTKKLTEIEDYEPFESYPRWGNVSPDKKHVVFSKNFNLWYMDMENFEKARKDSKDTTIVEHQLTTEGTAEFGFGSGNSNIDATEKQKKQRMGARIIWSPDSKKFVLIRSNTEKVKDLWVIDALAQPRPKLEKYKYHMPGEAEAASRHLYIYDMDSKEMKEINATAFKDQELGILPAPPLKKEIYDTLKHIVWQGNNNEFYLIRTSRDLKRIDFCAVDIATDSVKPIIEERLNTYIETRQPRFAGDNIIWWSERSGWAHLYLYDTKGTLVNQITSGEFHVEDVVAVDETQKVIYFTANGREVGENPYYTHQYRVNFDGSNLKLLNPGNYNHSAYSSENGKYFINNYSEAKKISAPTLERHHGMYYLRYTTTEYTDINKTELSKQKILAVDLGINHDAVCSVVDSKGTVLVRSFIDLPKEKDHLYHKLNKLKGFQCKNGSHSSQKQWNFVNYVNDEISRKT